MDDLVQVEQYVERKSHADGYLEVSRAPEFIARKRPPSALMAAGPLLPEGCVVNPTGIAVIPGDEHSKELLSSEVGGPGSWPKFGTAYQEPPYNEIATAGPYVFTVGDFALKHTIGLHPDVKTPDWIWWGSDIRNEGRFLLEVLKKRLNAAGSDLTYAVRSTVFLTDLADLYELDLVWAEQFGDEPPARTVIPVPGLPTPRREGVRGHVDGANVYESMFQSIRPGFGVDKEIVNIDEEPLGCQSTAVRAGDLLWISGQLAGGARHRAAAVDGPRQVNRIFEKLDDICRKGGTALNKLLQLRAFVTDPTDGYSVYAALRDAVPANPPCVLVSTVPGPLQIPGCSVIVDAVAYVD
jgi:enamine deaminase RidA (YjgF/YER057c/UK114 family)